VHHRPGQLPNFQDPYILQLLKPSPEKAKSLRQKFADASTGIDAFTSGIESDEALDFQPSSPWFGFELIDASSVWSSDSLIIFRNFIYSINDCFLDPTLFVALIIQLLTNIPNHNNI